MIEHTLYDKCIKLIQEGEFEFRSCYKCNPAHEHLKYSNTLILCFICGHFYYNETSLSAMKKELEEEKQMKAKNTEQNNTPKIKPEQKFRAGSVTATIWAKELEKDGKKFNVYNIEVVRNYKEKESDEWKKTSSFAKDDLQKAILVMQKAQEYLYLNEEEGE